MRNKLRTTVGVLTAALSVLVFVVAPVSAEGNTQFSGVGVFGTVDQCPDLPSELPPIVMAGDLVGCWYTTTLEPVQATPSGVYRERGTETFIGCLSDGTTCGTIDITYQFQGKFAPDGSEIHGHCEHPFVSGTGDFEGIKGWLHMKDDVETGEFNYRGHFKLD
jgi:hypothetical protein